MSSELPSTRSVVALYGDGTFRLIERELPALDSSSVLVEVKASLVSPGSELKGPVKPGVKSAGGWRGLREMQLAPDLSLDAKPFGYSNAGIVVAIGEDVEGVQVGDRVACIGAGYAQHSSYSLVPHNLVAPMPDKLTFEQASYGMLLATALQATRRAAPSLGEFAAVAGLGMVGLLTARILQLSGCYVIGWDTLDLRLQLATDFGIDATVNVLKDESTEATKEFTNGRGLDLSVIALGGDAEKPAHALEKCMKISPDGHAMGTMVVVGGAEFPFTRSLTNMDVRRSSRTGPGYHDKKWERGTNYGDVFVRWNTRSNLELCLRWVAEGKIPVEKLTTHRVPFLEIPECVAEISKNPDSILGMVFEM